MYKTILTATDGSAAAGRALEAAIDLAIKYKARLYIAHVHLHGRPVEEFERMAEIEHIVPEMKAHVPSITVTDRTMMRDILSESEHEALVISTLGDMILNRALQQAQEAGVENVETYSASGDYADGILDAIDETGADLVVMGRRGLGKVRQLLLGSVSNKVAQHTDAAVLLVH
jgi:nucleotide-binding universal stress UspA family protein